MTTEYFLAQAQDIQDTTNAFSELIEEVSQYIRVHEDEETLDDPVTGEPNLALANLRCALDRAYDFMASQPVGKVRDQYDNDIEQLLVMLPDKSQVTEMLDCGMDNIKMFLDAEWYEQKETHALYVPARFISEYYYLWTGEPVSVNDFGKRELDQVSRALRRFNEVDGFYHA